MDDLILTMKGINKSFSGVHALEDVCFELRRGEVHALIGENGAGKSTLMKILLGIYKRDAGEVIYNNQAVHFSSPAVALRHGISMIHQEISLVPAMDVAENVWLGREDNFMRAGVLINLKRRYQATEELLKTMGVSLPIHKKVHDLSVAQMQLVELVRAVSYDPSIIIMDEPTSALPDNEIELLFDVVRNLAAKGVSIIFISHKLEEIFRICQRVTIFRDGHYIAVRDCEGITKGELINMIVGRKVDVLFEKQNVVPGAVVLEVKGLNRRGVCRDVNFYVRRGEVLGFCGLMGAGRSEILRAVFGIDRKTSGRILINGKEVKIKNPKDAVKNGIGMVTEDRLRLGVIRALSVMANTTIASFDKICYKTGFFSKSREAEVFTSAAHKLSVKYDSPDSLVNQLSGGNQQKVVIGRWLLNEPQILFLDEPTRGIDVGSKNEIYKLIDTLAAQGMAIVLISSELPELFSLCDRIAVIAQGRLVFECPRGEATQELLMSHAFVG
jgi:ABC-type sugar transport system ATPase subunit